MQGRRPFLRIAGLFVSGGISLARLIAILLPSQASARQFKEQEIPRDSAMSFLTRNCYYLRVSSSSIIPLYVGWSLYRACHYLRDRTNFVDLSGQPAC